MTLRARKGTFRMAFEGGREERECWRVGPLAVHEHAVLANGEVLYRISHAASGRCLSEGSGWPRFEALRRAKSLAQDPAWALVPEDGPVPRAVQDRLRGNIQRVCG